jgi:hypothetical protein
MSSRERREEKRKKWEEEQARQDRERYRIENLSMYSRIEEFVQDEQLKFILHKICERIELEE